MNELYVFSILSGTVYKIEEADLKVLFNYQIPITQPPKHNCKKCHGTGVIGRDIKTGFYHMCSCISSKIREGHNTSNIVVEMPRLAK